MPRNKDTRVKAYRWSWTLNHPTQTEIQTLMNLTKLTSQELQTIGITYLIAGKETGSQGTFHLQGYTEFSSRMRMSAVKTTLQLDRLHLENSKGTGPQNKEYCSKDGDLLLEIGSLKPTGGGNTRASILDDRLTSLKNVLDDGGKLEDCWEQDFSAMVRYGRGIYEYAMLKGVTRTPPKVTVLTGSPGTGKTFYCYEHARLFAENDIWSYPGQGWFDGYSGQKCALFDDYRGDLPLELFLKVLDRYPIRVPVKGGFRNWNPIWIFITSNVDWDSWYPNVFGDCRMAIRRRIHVLLDKINEKFVYWKSSVCNNFVPFIPTWPVL